MYLNFHHNKNAYERLQIIHSKVCELVKDHCSHELAIEAPFFGKNVQSMLKAWQGTRRSHSRGNAGTEYRLQNILRVK